MICENKMGGDFENLAQRLIYEYKVSYPKFKPIQNDEVSEEAQKQMHNFFGHVLCKIYDNPALIDLPLESDACFNGEQLKDKPELASTMKALEKKFLGFFDFIFEIGDIGVVKDNKLYIIKADKKIQKSKLVLLEQLGLNSELTKDATILYSDEFPKVFSALKLLCDVCKKAEGRTIKNPVVAQSITRLMFMRCIFDKEHITWTNLYGDLVQSSSYLEELEDYFINKGYSYVFKDAGFNLVYEYTNKQDGAFSIGFDWRIKNQLNYTIKVPGFRLLMNHFDEMSDDLKELIFSRTGRCSSCGYCTQTDKTGKRKPVAIPIEYHGEKVYKCPLYPNLGWGELDEKTVTVIKDLFRFAENNILENR